MRSLGLCLVVASLIGCDDFDKALNEPARQTVTTPAGIATGSDVSAVQNATGGGTVAPATAPAANPPPAAATDPNAAAAVPPAAQKGAIIGKTTSKIVDLAEAKKDPKIVEVDKKDLGSDPLTVSFNAYVSITSRASVLNFKHQMDILKAANDDKYPTFKEAEKLMKQLNIQLAELPPYQLYGYDAKTGGIVLLENKAEKIRLYKQNNIPLDEADKPFDAP
ncbi:MAG: hypothetical protein FD138_1949 [Planctomycetota bacterium]|nr:MAG: hypothetical protein FD138_1949 [Planctomycetota bacterium]